MLKREKLATYGTPKTKGDRLPTVRRPEGMRFKDGLEEKWSLWEARAIRLLADPMGPVTLKGVAIKCSIKLITLKKWCKNPYFIMAVDELADHYLRQNRTAVLGTLISRAVGGNMTAVRMFLQMMGDLRDGSGGGGIQISNVNNIPAHSSLSEEEMDQMIAQQLRNLHGDETPGDWAERVSQEKPSKR